MTSDIDPPSTVEPAHRPGTCVITGGTRGIGRALALELARRGAPVVIVGRDRDRGIEARDALCRQGGSEDVRFVCMDLASLADVRAGVAELVALHPRLSTLVNNAGVYSLRSRSSADGIELTMAVNYLSAYLLTRLLLPALLDGAPARVVNVTSKMERYARNDFSDSRVWKPGGGGPFGFMSYARSKRALVLFTRELASRLDGSGVTSSSVHPGFVGTDLLRDLPRWVRRLYEPRLRTPEESAGTIADLATGPEYAATNGAHFLPGPREARSSAGSRHPDHQRDLWRMSAELVGLPE